MCEYLALPGGPGRFTRNSTSSVLLGDMHHTGATCFVYGTLTHSGTVSHQLRLHAATHQCLGHAEPNTHTPQHPNSNTSTLSHCQGLGSSSFARHYSRNHSYFLFLRVLRCFTSPRQPPHRLCIHLQVTPHNRCWVSPFGHPRINA